jgi:phosphoserine phosphatase
MTILCVDLDGTLIRIDTTWLATKLFLQSHPSQCWRLLLWLVRGRAYLKHQLGQLVHIEPRTLPYNDELIQWLTERKQLGDTLVLATATDRVFAQAIADHLGIFSQIIASDGHTNLRAKWKAAALTQHFGLKGYCYVGNSYDDLEVWKEANSAVVVHASERLKERVRKIVTVERVFD